MTPLIGITCGSSALDPGAKNPQDQLNCAYTLAVARAGGAPVIVPNLTDPTAIELLLDRLDGLMLSGGYDVHPRFFDEATLNGSVEIDEPRDAAELPLILAALERDIPILAICRGIQSLNVVLGGSLYQDIPSQIPSPIRHSQAEPRPTATHSIEISRGSRMAEIAGSSPMNVNSMHHQPVKDLGSRLELLARPEDGVIEPADMAGKRFVVAVQFHPE